MIRIREQQQKAYEEQALRYAEQKKAVSYLFIYLNKRISFSNRKWKV
jgi:hypothetical protein